MRQQPDSLTQGLASFMGQFGNQFANQRNQADAEAMRGREREGRMEDQTTLMGKQQGFSRENMGIQEGNRRRTEALGLYNKIATDIGAFAEKDPAKQNLLLKRAEDIMREHYSPAYKYLVTEMGKKTEEPPPPTPPNQGGPMDAVGNFFWKSDAPPVNDSFGSTFPRSMDAFKQGMIPGVLNQPGTAIGDIVSGTGEMIGNTMGIGTPKVMRPMPPQMPQQAPSMPMQPPMMPTPGPQMPAPMRPTSAPSMAPRLMKSPKAKLRKKL